MVVSCFLLVIDDEDSLHVHIRLELNFDKRNYPDLNSSHEFLNNPKRRFIKKELANAKVEKSNPFNPAFLMATV
ncbi:hypothetical protein VNO77_42001 [Canavalia gladiata]|uniref:Uncharacterized protein n=1 Tax=Canavalia gladiata TaxID=3824 RepID=A0AAN9K090_CANGL